MGTQQQWVVHSGTSSQQGWMLSAKASNLAGTKQQLRSLQPKTSKVRKGWALGATSPYEADIQPVIFSKTSEALAINCHKLSAHLIDGLAEKNLDWISLLTNDWQLEIFNTALLGIESFQQEWKLNVPSVENLVKLTQQVPYYPVIVADETYWSYTCCLQVAELGRVRFLVCFPDSEHCGKYAALITNRLDWSPRKVILQYIQLPIWPKLLESRAPLTISKRPSLQQV